MSRAILPLALLSALFCTLPAAAQSPTDTVVVVSGTPVVFPTEAAGFVLGETKTFENEADGTSLRYQGPQRLRADVYVYPVPREGCTAGCDALAVNGEADAFTGMIPTLLERGYYETLRVDSDTTVRTGAMEGRHLAMSGTRRGEPHASHFYLFGGGDYLLKVRATYPPDPASDAALAELVRALVGGVQEVQEARAGTR